MPDTEHVYSQCILLDYRKKYFNGYDAQGMFGNTFYFSKTNVNTTFQSHDHELKRLKIGVICNNIKLIRYLAEIMSGLWHLEGRLLLCIKGVILN